MFVFSGEGTYGVVERCGRAYVGTRFQHVQLMPLFPKGTFLFLEDEHGVVQGAIPLKTSWRSVLAGYMRTWGLVGAFVAAVSLSVALRGAAHGGGVTHSTLELVGVGLAWVVYAAVAFGLGVLTPEEQAQRRVYEGFAGAPVDVASLEALPGDRVDALRAEVTEVARSHAAKGYRTAADPERDWASILAGADVHDVKAVRAAFTLSRLVWATATATEKPAIVAQQERLWTRLVELDPSVSSAG